MNPFAKVAGGAASLFSRAVQFTEERLGHAEKTEHDPQYLQLADRADKTRQWTEKIIKHVEGVLQPNPNLRMEDFLMEKLGEQRRSRTTSLEQLGVVMMEAGNDVGPSGSYGNLLLKVGEMEKRLGQSELEFIRQAASEFIIPLKNFLDTDIKNILKEQKVLETRRLDLDAVKGKLKKAKSLDPVKAKDKDEQIGRAENELRISQTDFDRQVETTKLLLEGIEKAQAHHERCLKDLVEAQVQYYAQCYEQVKSLQEQLQHELN